MNTNTNTDNEYAPMIILTALENGGRFEQGKTYHLELSSDTMGYITTEDQTVQPITGLLQGIPFRYNPDVPFRQVWSVSEDGVTAVKCKVSNSEDHLNPDDARWKM